jgi:xenotropic and polytropic retrovirus receptor 1
MNTAQRVREAESVQRALVDHYRTAKLLHNFAIMNYTGFVKIIKKYEKTAPKGRRGRYGTIVATRGAICGEGRAVEALAARMELLYANWFCDRNVSEARAQMLTKKGDGLEMDWSQLRLGYRMGMCSILALWVCWDCIWGLMSQGHSTIGGRTAFPVFRGCGGLIVLQWCWGFSVWVWSRYRVNYIYLFDFNPSVVASPLAIFNEAVDNTLVYMICTLLYYKAGAHDIPGSFPAGIFPFILVMYTIYNLIFPLRSRCPMWEAIWHVITAPMHSPTFFHGYVGDIFTSLVKVFQDLAWTIFFVLSGDWLISEDLKASAKHHWAKSHWYSNILIPLLTLLPLWFRFNQCLRRYADTGKRFPHLANAFKYALSQTVTLFGAFHPLYMRNKKESELFQAFWTFAFVASSLYSFWWDVYQVPTYMLVVTSLGVS